MGNSGVTYTQPEVGGAATTDNDRIDSSVGRTLDIAELKWAQGIAVNRAGNLVVTDFRGHQVLVVDADGGQTLSAFGSFGIAEGKLNRPDGVCVDPRSGNVLVADSFNGRVQVFSSAGKPLSVVGRPGRGTNRDVTNAGTSTGGGTLNDPKGVCITPDGYVLVSAENGLHAFDPSGQFVRRLSKRARNPSGLALDLHNTDDVPASPSSSSSSSPAAASRLGAGSWRCLVADLDRDAVQVFSSTGSLVRRLGGTGTGPGQLSSPVGVAVDGAGNVFVADAANRRIQMWLPSGEPAGEVSLPFQPSHVAIGPQGTVYLTGAGRVHVIAPSVARAVPLPMPDAGQQLSPAVARSASSVAAALTPKLPATVTVEWLAAELQRVTAERDALRAQVEQLRAQQQT